MTPWTAACKASESFATSWSLLKLKSTESVMPSSYLILCHPFSSCPQTFPASGSFPMSQFFASGGQRIGASASASVLPRTVQDWFPLSVLCIRWPKYWSFSFSISPSKDCSGLIPFRIDWFYHKYFSTSLRILWKYSFSSCKILYKRRHHSLLNQSLIVRRLSYF